MDVLGMRSQGWTIAEIARETNYHPATVSKWLKNGGPPPKRSIDPASLVVDGRWGSRIAELIEPPSRLLSTSVYEIIAVEGFRGSYPSVVRQVRELRGPRFRPAPQVSVPIETAPGEESPIRLLGLLGARTPSVLAKRCGASGRWPAGRDT